jgi:hypothetical protein
MGCTVCEERAKLERARVREAAGGKEAPLPVRPSGLEVLVGKKTLEAGVTPQEGEQPQPEAASAEVVVEPKKSRRKVVITNTTDAADTPVEGEQQ